MRLSLVLPCLMVLLGALTTRARASEVHELEALLRRIEVGIVQDDEVVSWLREPRDVADLREALREALGPAGATSPRRAATALAALVVVEPLEAPRELVRALAHPRAEVRVAALALLADVAPREPGGEVRSALLEHLARGPRSEVALAIAALGTWGDPGTCLLPILEAVEREPAHSDLALDALFRLVGTDAGDLSAWWRVWAESAALWPEHAVLVAVLDDGDPKSVLAALEKLALLPDARTFAAIDRLVRRVDASGGWAQPLSEQQGLAAARALGTLRDPRGEPALQVMLVSESGSEALRAAARAALARLRHDAPRLARDRSAGWTRSADDAPSLATAPAGGEVASPGEPAADLRQLDERMAASLAWGVAGAALLTAAFAALARRLERSSPPRPARTAEAARSVARALKEIELEPVTSLRPTRVPDSADPADASAPSAPSVPEAGDDVVHVVLGHAPRWHERRPALEAAPVLPPTVDPGWRSVMEGLDELGGNVGRVVARVNGAAEQVVYDAGEDVSLADAMATLSSLRGSLDDVRVELAGANASMVVYTARPAARPAEAARPGPAPVGAPEPEPAWRELVAALAELGASVAEVWAQVAGEPARRRWAVEQGGVAGAVAALEGLRPRLVQVGVRLVGGPAELALFEAPSPPPSTTASRPADPAWSGLLEALRSMNSAVSGLTARLRCPPGSPPLALFPSPEAATLDEAAVTLEELEPLVAEVRVQLSGVGGDLVLLDREGPPPRPAAAATVAPASSAGWLELIRAVEEIGEQVEAVVVRGADGETVVLRADDEGGLPELLASLRALEGTAAHVHARLVAGGAEVVLLDLPVAAAPAAASPPMRTSMTWRHVLGSLEAMGEALDAISAQVVGADRRLLFGPGTPRSLEQALSELGDGHDYQDVKVRLKHSPSELTLFDRALAS